MQDRAYRIAQEKRIIKKRLKIVKRSSDKLPDASGKTHYQIIEEKQNLLGKQHPMDCGNPKCQLCHYEKVMGKKKPSDRRKELVETDEDDLEEQW